MGDWWQSLFQTTVDAYYRGDLRAGLDACERLLSLDSLPPEIAYQVRRNLVFYAPQLAQVAPSAASRAVAVSLPEGWTRYNPSLAAADDGFRMVLRSGNYSVDKQLKYTVHDEDGVVRTTNYLIDLAADLSITGLREIDDSAVRQDPPLFPVAGFEDCRLVRHRDHWWLSATTRDQNDQGVCQIALLRLEGTVVTAMHLLSDGVARHEKNWMPVADADDATLRFVYSCYPTAIVRYDDATGTAVPERTHEAPLIARDFSGGSQAIPIDDGHLGLVHERAIFEDGGRCYTHRWVWFDAAWRLAKLSLPFIFHDRGVEFAAGLARRGDDLVISYGLWDREARLMTVSLAEVLALLAPPLDAGMIEAEATAGSPVAVAAGPVAPAMTTTLRPDAQFTPFPNGRPTLVSTTMTGNSEETIGDAIRSVVAWVDQAVLIDTGITDATLEIARDVAGDKLVVREFPWRQDFAAARNFALQAAAETGADWAVHVDSDEWLLPGDLDIRGALAATSADSLHVMNTDATYGKERFFRLPVRGRYVGPTHEAFIRASGTSQVLEGVHFAEHGKSREQYRRKAERDIEILQRHTAEHPTDPRWFYYLGDSLAGIDRREEAITAFRTCWELKGWDEEGAWAMYRAGKCLLELDRVEEAIDVCAMGMARHAGLAELPWLAGYACWQAGRPAQAAYWAGISITMGHFAGSGAMVPRIGFRHPPALWEGPYDVLRFALRALGEDASADEAERLYHEAKDKREAGERG